MSSAHARLLLTAAILGAGSALASTALAESAAFTDDLLFFESAQSMPDVVSFETAPAGDLGASAQVGSVAFGYTTGLFGLVAGDAFGTSSPTRSLGTASEDQAFIGGDSLELAVDQPVQALGLYLVVGESELDPAFFTLTTSTGEIARSGGRKVFTIADGSVYFLGIVDTQGFSSATLRSSSSEDLVFNVDDVVLFDEAAVREASAGLQALVALLALGLRRHRAVAVVAARRGR